MANKLQFRRDTAAAWTTVNPILAAGEPAIETDTKRRKTGDGTSTWTQLPYQFDGSTNPALTVTYNADGTVATTTQDGVLTTFTYNADGTVKTQTRGGVTRTFTYDANGNVTGAA